MSWHGLHGHDDVVARFRAILARGRLANTYLFVGPRGVGKRAFALRLAQTLLCLQRPIERLDPCGLCAACVQAAAGTHPDLLRIAKPRDKSFIPLELFIGPKERRMQEGLCHDIGLKPFMGGRRVAVIDDADHLNDEGANSLLKTLEEPPPRSVMILISTSLERQLPTIRSRAQTIRFRPLSAEIIAQLLLEQSIVADRSEAQRLATYSEGSLEAAIELADPELWKFRSQLLAQLAAPALDGAALAKMVGPFVEEAGKEAAARRARMRQVLGFAVEFYRHALRGLAGLPPSDDPEMAQAAAACVARGLFDDEAAVTAIDRCLEALEQVDRNANQAALLECWTNDLGQIALLGRLPAAV